MCIYTLKKQFFLIKISLRRVRESTECPKIGVFAQRIPQKHAKIEESQQLSKIK